MVIVGAFTMSAVSCPNRISAQRPFGAHDKDQSAYALGSFALSVIFVESDGSLDSNQEDWTAGQLTNLHVEIEQAVSFWEGLTSSYHPNAQLDITVDYVNGGVPLDTRYEPITRNGLSSSSFWMNDVMNSLGYSDTNSNVNTRAFNNDQRASLDTHWAATLYVVNDTVDSDNAFSDGYFAFSLYGGPYVVTTYSNGGWGNSRYDRVLSHELGHIFFALDEYYASNARNTARSGYLNGINGNAERNAQGAKIPAPQPNALMLNTVLDPSTFTSVQVGHLDTDGDSIPDILDTIPYIVATQADGDADAGTFSFTGTGHVRPMDNNNPKVWAESGAKMTINTLGPASYNLDGQGWIDLPPADGSYGGYAELIELELSGLDVGLHTIDLRITNSMGNHSDLKSYELFVTPEPGSLGMVCFGVLAVLRRGRKRRRSPVST
jgi:hypothetical protein